MENSEGTVFMTAEEEAELLAQYGTYNPLDDLIDIQAPSQYRSIYNTKNLFLTNEDEGAEEQNSDAVHATLSQLDYTAPVELFLLRQLELHGISRPAVFNEVITSAVETLKSQANAMHSDDDGDDDSDFDTQLQKLISDAEAEIQHKNFHYDPASDPVFQERLRMLKEDESNRTPLNDEAFDDDAALLSEEELLAIKADVTQRPCVPVLMPNEEAELAEIVTSDAAAERKKEMRANELTFTEQAARKKNKVIGDSVAVERSAIDTAQKELSLTELLDQIATIDQRDALLEIQAATEIRRQMNVLVSSASAVAQQQNATASSRGSIAFDIFSSKIDQLIQPTAVPETISAIDDSQSKSLHQLKSVPKMESVQEMKRKSQRREFLLRREAQESRLMRFEDDRVNALERLAEKLRVERDEMLNQFHAFQDQQRRSVLGEEAVAHVEIIVREERQRTTLQQIILQRAAQRKAVLISELTTNFDALSQGIAQLQECEWNDLICVAQVEKTALQGKQAALEEQLRRLERHLCCQVEDVRSAWWQSMQSEGQRSTQELCSATMLADAFGERFANNFERRALLQVSFLDRCCGFGGKSEQLLTAVATRAAVMHTAKNDIVAVMQAMTHALRGAVAARSAVLRRKKSSSSVRSGNRTPTSPPPTAAATTSDECEAEAVLLDANFVRRLFPVQFAAALSDLTAAPQIFQSLSFALENIQTIHYSSLADLCIAAPSATVSALSEAACVKVTQFVRQLDLGCNCLTEVDLCKLIECFPSLVALHLNDNKLADASLGASNTGVALPSLTLLNVSANDLRSIDCLSAFPELRRFVAFANKISTLKPLAECPNLREVEMSRNVVESMDGIPQLLSLGTLDLSRNNILSFDALKSNITLQKLFLSCNKISALPKHMPLMFLRQLFLNENKLTEVPAEIGWLPMLSDLHLESNVIRSIEGLRGCFQLSNLNLAFNQLSSIESLDPLSACKQIRSLSLNDNPMMLIPYVAAEVERLVVSMLPLLKDYNTEVLKEDRKRNGRVLFSLCNAVFPMALAGHVRGCTPYDTDIWASYRFFSYFLCSHASSGKPSDSTVQKVRVGYGVDALLDRLQQEYEALHIHGHRRLQTALSIEENLKTRCKERGGFVVPALYTQSSAISERNYVDSLQQTQRHIELLREQPSLDTLYNTHSVSIRYEQRARTYREARAKAKIAQWIVGRLLICKARSELGKLRDASEIGRLRKWTKAALKIQPVWRGAIVRRRLKSVKHIDDDDDELFQKVSFEQPENPIAYSNFATLFQSAMLSHPHAAPFQVVSSATPNVSSVAPRTGSAPSLQGNSARDGARPQSNPAAGLYNSTASDEQQHAMSARTTLDDEWGTALADQLRKKNKKMEKAKQDMIRKEFLNDPLRAKKLQGK